MEEGVGANFDEGAMRVVAFPSKILTKPVTR